MMEERKQVILYGDTVLLEGIRASLEANPGLKVFVLNPSTDEPFDEIGRVRPAAVVFDLGVVRPDSLFPLLQQPGLLLIGIDPEMHRALVWSGKQVAAASAGDLIGMIQKSGKIPSP